MRAAKLSYLKVFMIVFAGVVLLSFSNPILSHSRILELSNGDIHRKTSFKGYSQNEITGDFSGLGQNDSGGSGFKTISLNGILVSNATSLDNGRIFPSQASNSTIILKVDLNVYPSINVIDIELSSYTQEKYPDLEVTFKDPNGNVIKAMSGTNDQLLPITKTSVASYLTVNNTLPVANVGSIEFSGYTGQNFQVENLTFNTDNNTAPTASNVSISGTMALGEELTGNYTYNDADNDDESGSAFLWYRSNDEGGSGKTEIAGATSSTYTLTSEDVDKYISFEVTPNDGTAAGTAVESALEYVFYEISDRNALQFDGINDRVEIADDAAFDFSGGFTAQLWVYPEEIATSGIISQYSNGEKAFSAVLTGDGKIELTISRDGTEDDYFVTAGTISADEWSHLTFTYDGSTMKIYVNGVEDANSKSVSGTMYNSSAEIEIASRDGAYHFEGKIDELKFWSKALSSSEINQTKDCRVSTTASGLIAYYDFNQGTSGGSNSGITSILDRTSNMLNGTPSSLSLSGNTSNFIVGAQEGGIFSETACINLPFASNVAISGDAEEGTILTGIYDYSDDDNDEEDGTTFKWYRYNDNNGGNEEEITGATDTFYIASQVDVGKYLRFEVTPENENESGDPIFSVYFGPITDCGVSSYCIPSPIDMPVTAQGANMGAERIEVNEYVHQNDTYSTFRQFYQNYYCSENIELYSGEDNTLKIYTKTNRQKVKVFIDYNNDGDFKDADELVYNHQTELSSNGDEIHATTIIPDGDAPLNTKLRMRVIADWFNSDLGDCDNPSYGQVEDYGVTILNGSPSATNVSIVGTLELGETLNGDYDYSDALNDQESGTTFQWYRSDDDQGTNKTEIGGATSSTYTLTSNDVDKYISFEVTPNDGTSAGTAVESGLSGPVTDPLFVSSIERQDPSDETVSAQSVTFRVT
ncbi:MAG: hypothetical protein HWE07_08110, partial [Cytophagia bacterium]|nr:hypothetical protein [Cytophagia bacterium]